VVDADLKSYFDTIPHERLLALVKARVADGRVLALVESFLRAGVMEEAKGWQPTDRGTPQGGVISPLLANVYLNPLDHQRAQAGWQMVRYADDFVIPCRREAEAQAALAAVRAWVSEAGLSLLEKRRGRTRHGLGLAHRRWPNAWFASRGLLSLAVEHALSRTIVATRTHGLESRMREIRPSGSEGGVKFHPSSLPLS